MPPMTPQKSYEVCTQILLQITNKSQKYIKHPSKLFSNLLELSTKNLAIFEKKSEIQWLENLKNCFFLPPFFLKKFITVAKFDQKLTPVSLCTCEYWCWIFVLWKNIYRISTSVSNVLLIWALNHQIEKVLDYVFCKSEYIIKYINSFGTDWTILYFLNFLENCQPIMWKTFRKSAKTKVMQSMQKPRHNWHFKS